MEDVSDVDSVSDEAFDDAASVASMESASTTRSDDSDLPDEHPGDAFFELLADEYYQNNISA